MKLTRKILFIALIATLVVSLGCFIAFDASHVISRLGNDLNALHDGYVDFGVENINATISIIYSAFGVATLGAVVLATIQFRRRKTIKFSVYVLLLLAMGLMLIFDGSNYFALRSGAEKVITYVLYFLIMAELLANAILSVPQTFETSELKANAKKRDFVRWVDLGVALGLFVLYFVLLAVISGGNFGDIFKHFFTFTLAAKGNVFSIILVVVELIGLGFVTYKLVKKRKPILGPLFLLFVEFVGYTYYYYGRVIDYNAMLYLGSGNFAKILLILVVQAYFFAVVIFGMYTTTDTVIIFFENKRQKLYNHREKYVYGDRRRFGDSIVKEWEEAKKQGYASAFGSSTVSDEELVFDDEVTGFIKDANDVSGTVELGEEQQTIEEEVSVEEAKSDDTDDKGRSITLDAVSPEAQLDFRVKLMSLEPEKRERYNKVRNRLQSYKKIKQKFSKTVDSYRYAGELVAKMSVLGSTLRLHLALDPDSYDVEKYHQIDLSSKSKYIFVPFTLKLKGPKSVELALQLIDELMAGFDIPQNPSYKDEDCVAKVEEELKAEGIIK